MNTGTNGTNDYEYEHDVCQMLERIVKPGWVCADVGAYVGYITVLLAQLVGPKGKVYAFEAYPEHSKVLKQNISDRGLTSLVQVENIAISDGSLEKVWLFRGRNEYLAREWNIIGQDVEGNPTEPELQIQATSLDNYFPPGSRLDLVKIDIEGAAGFAFSGMERLLKEVRPVLVIEFHGEEWNKRQILYDAHYDLYDMNGNYIDPNAQCHYHCIAFPRELSCSSLETTNVPAEFTILSAEDYINLHPTEGNTLEIPASLKENVNHLPPIYILNDMMLAGDSGLPISKIGEVISDRLINFNVDKELEFIQPEELSTVRSHQRKGKYMPLYGDWAEGFYHWMLDNLPSVIIAEKSGYDGSYIIPSTSHAKQSLDLLGINPERILEYAGGHWHVETLYLPHRINGWALKDYPEILYLLRESLIDSIYTSKQKATQQRIYISRNKLRTKRRIVINEEALLEVLASFGFKTVFMEEMSLKEQVALMSNAHALVTPHGAGMVHTLFMPPQSLVVELFAPTYINPTTLPVIDFLQHRYYMIPSYLNAIPPIYSFGGDIEAFIQVIEMTLRRELGSGNAYSRSDSIK